MEVVYVIDCPDHESCDAVCCEVDGATVWVSHAPSEIDVEPRLSAEHGDVEDYRE